LQAVLHPRDRAPDDDAHRVIQVRGAHLVLNADRDLVRGSGRVLVGHLEGSTLARAAGGARGGSERVRSDLAQGGPRDNGLTGQKGPQGPILAGGSECVLRSKTNALFRSSAALRLAVALSDAARWLRRAGCSSPGSLRRSMTARLSVTTGTASVM